MKEFNEQNIDDDSVNSDQNENNSTFIRECPNHINKTFHHNLNLDENVNIEIDCNLNYQEIASNFISRSKDTKQLKQMSKMSKEEQELYLFKNKEYHRKRIIKEGYEEYKAQRREQARICWQNKSVEEKRNQRNKKNEYIKKYKIKKRLKEDPNYIHKHKPGPRPKLKEKEECEIKKDKLKEDFTIDEKKLLRLKRKRNEELQDKIQKQDISKLKAANYNQSHDKQKIIDKNKFIKENKRANQISYTI